MPTFDNGGQALVNGNDTANGINRKTFYIDSVAPSVTVDTLAEPFTGQLWLDTSKLPYEMKEYDGTVWNVIGQFSSTGWGAKYGDQTSQDARIRMNWKQLIYDTGANINALDYTTGLVSRYSFASDGTDNTGSNNLTLTGTPTFPAGIYGNGMLLNGTTMFAQASANTIFDQTTTSFGMSVWINLAALPGTKGYIVSKRDDSGTNPGFDVYVNSSGKIVAEICDTSNNLGGNTSTLALTTNTWYHILIYWNRGGNLYCYINGVLDSSTGINANTCTNTQTFTVGRHSASSASFLNATFDSLAMWNSSGAFNTASNARIVFADCQPGMLAFCQLTGNSFTTGGFYERNAENTAWLTIPQVQSKTVTQGDILVAGSGGVYDRLALGATNQVLTSNGTTAVWQAATAVVASVLEKSENAAADASLLSYTPPAAGHMYQINFSSDISANTSGVVAFAVSYKDSKGQTVTTIKMPYFTLNSASVVLTSTPAAGTNISGTFIISIDASATAITVGWVGGGSALTATASVAILLLK